MHPLNPFLRAFFRSTLPAQCTPVQNHVLSTTLLIILQPLLTPPAQILLVPITEVLLNFKDAESNTPYTDLSESEEFLGSHVLRLSGDTAALGRDGSTVRDSRSKARQFNTMNGRTVVVKDGLVYSNKGFKMLNQAQLLNDIIWYPDSIEPQEWLIYYISKPLVGTLESTAPYTDSPWLLASANRSAVPIRSKAKQQIETVTEASTSTKRAIGSFNDLLNQFPMIARQMQPGLERLFKVFAEGFPKPLPPAPPNASPSQQAATPATTSSPPTDATVDEDQEVRLRADLETAITAAIDLFQLTDKQQLSLLGATTDLTGPAVERLIERYVTEQVHESIVFPRLRSYHKDEDAELEALIHQMESIDISQVGIPIKGGITGKREFLVRLDKGVEEFRKLGVAGSPQEMLQVLLNTEKAISYAVSYNTSPLLNGDSSPGGEKVSTTMTVNADTLVSLLLVVVIRAQVRHLQARLTYMRSFIFVEDLESGETGYALSTFEAVLMYLANDSSGLRNASRRNKRLWHAIRTGDISIVKDTLEPSDGTVDDQPDEEPGRGEPETSSMGEGDQNSTNTLGSLSRRSSRASFVEGGPTFYGYSEPSSLNHVFPFQIQRNSSASSIPDVVARKGKRVVLDTRSMSSSSVYSFHSRSTTIDSLISGIENDTSIERLTGTQDSNGRSLLMMAIEHHQRDILEYLLSLKLYFPREVILEDTDNDGTSLLMAAVQSADKSLVEIVLNAIISDTHNKDWDLWNYINIVDVRGRSVGHYIVDSPHLIFSIGHLLPWRQRDRNGQTPLFSLCRAYDHSQYSQIISAGLEAALGSQMDGQKLHLDDHVDIKGNTLLHVVNDAQLARRLLFESDSDINAMNDKHFTPLMVASKYGRVEMVRCFFDDARTDLYARELRGFTAVELAKDDEVRNRIDDLILLSHAVTTDLKDESSDGRVTAVVRSFFVEDASVRLILKSGIPTSPTSYTVTTCRRSLIDFESLARWLSVEHPASWIPSMTNFRSPFQIPSRPSRSVLRAIQSRLDGFLHTLLTHPTFATHEMLWEFFLVPEMHIDMMAARSKAKAAARMEKLKEEYEPVEDTEGAELFTRHARETIRGVSAATKSVVRRVNKMRNISGDLAEAYYLLNFHVLPFTFLPQAHFDALTALARAYTPPSASPHSALHVSLLTTLSTLSSVSLALSRPSALISSLQDSQRAVAKHAALAQRRRRQRTSDRAWPLDLGFGLLDDARARLQAEAERKVDEAQETSDNLAREIEASRTVVAAELAGWQAVHAKEGKRAVRSFVKAMCVREREVLAGLKRAVRALGREERGLVRYWTEETSGLTRGRRPDFVQQTAGGESARSTD